MQSFSQTKNDVVVFDIEGVAVFSNPDLDMKTLPLPLLI